MTSDASFCATTWILRHASEFKAWNMQHAHCRGALQFLDRQISSAAANL
jgi:hypothetical protein